MWSAKSEPAQAWIGVRRFAWSNGEVLSVSEVESAQQALELLGQQVAAGGVKAIQVWLSSRLAQLEGVPEILGAKNRNEALLALTASRGREADNPHVSLQLPAWPMTGSQWPLAVTDAEVLKSIEAICRRTTLSIKPWWSWVLSQETSTVHSIDARAERLWALFDGEALVTCLRAGARLVQASTVPMADMEHVRRAVERRRFGLPAATLVCCHLGLMQGTSEAAQGTSTFAFESLVGNGDAF